MPPTDVLGLHLQITRWIVLQKARRHPTSGLRLLVRTQFQDLFHSPSGVLLTFPSRYLYTIDRKIYLALGGGPPGFSQGFTCPDLLDKRNLPGITETMFRQNWEDLFANIRFAILRIPGYHCLWRRFPTASTRLAILLNLMQGNGSPCLQSR